MQHRHDILSIHRLNQLTPFNWVPSKRNLVVNESIDTHSNFCLDILCHHHHPHRPTRDVQHTLTRSVRVGVHNSFTNKDHFNHKESSILGIAASLVLFLLPFTQFRDNVRLYISWSLCIMRRHTFLCTKSLNGIPFYSLCVSLRIVILIFCIILNLATSPPRESNCLCVRVWSEIKRDHLVMTFSLLWDTNGSTASQKRTKNKQYYAKHFRDKNEKEREGEHKKSRKYQTQHFPCY